MIDLFCAAVVAVGILLGVCFVEFLYWLDRRKRPRIDVTHFGSGPQFTYTETRKTTRTRKS